MASLGDMPIDLVLVRHAESEGNLAQERSSKGDESAWSEDFKRRHNSNYRLTDRGRKQAKKAGKWINENFGAFDRYYCSEYIRAMETAALLNLQGPWLPDFFLRERDQGILAGKSKRERMELYPDLVNKKAMDPFYSAAPGGESIANASMRVHRVLSELKDRCSGFRVIMVCHGNIMWAFRVVLERMTQEEFRRLNSSREHSITNCSIIHYSRRNPETGQISDSLDWMRIICPWDPMLSEAADWTRVRRRVFTNEDLLKRVELVPQLINNAPEDLEKVEPGHGEKHEEEDY